MNKKLLSLAAVLLVSPATISQATILLNEIHLRTPASTDAVPNDGNHEFIELRSTVGEEACTDLWILVIDNDGSGVGEIKQAWALRNADGTWMVTGKNGLLLLGDDYIRPDSPYAGIKAVQTKMGDPDGMGPDNLEDANAVSVLLVRGYTNPAPLQVGQRPDIDIDNDGDGRFDWLDPTPPVPRYAAPIWAAIQDSIGFNGVQGQTNFKLTYAPANLSRTNTVIGAPQLGTGANFLPHTMARSATDLTPNSRTAWYGGTVPSSGSADSVTYGNSFFNLIVGALWRGLVTPGQANLSSAPVDPVFRINELNLNPPGTPGRSPDPATPTVAAANDGKFEYVEIINTVPNQMGGTNFSGSLATYALLVVDSGGANLGRIREVWNLSKFATGGTGLLLLGDDYAGGFSPFANNLDVSTQLADPGETLAPAPVPPAPQRFLSSRMSMGDLPNNGVTLLLVQNFTGLVDDDIDLNDDGIPNVAVPYTLVDSVAVPEVNALGGLVAGHGGYSVARPDILVAGRHYNADNLSRLAGNTDPNSMGAWSAGVFGSNSPYALAYRNGFNITGSGTAFRGAASPGKANYNAASRPAAGSFLLNEVHVNPPVAPDNTEYIEVVSTAPHALLTNHWLIVLDATATAASGRVKKVFDLRGQSTGANRLAIFADGIEEDGSALPPFVSARTVRDDPASFNADGTANAGGGFNFTPDSLEPDAGISVLLVTFTPATVTGVPATPDADLDGNNDGTLDVAPPWTLVDGISTGNGVGGVPIVPGTAPGNVSRHVKNTAANTATAWYGGELTGGLATSFDYSSNFFGTIKGAASPGRHNVIATPNSATTLLLNEININPPGGDNNKEFIELRSANNTAVSTNGYSVLLVDNDGTDTGRILEAWDLDSAATGGNGLLLTGVNYDAPGGTCTAEVATDVLTTSASHGLKVGDAVRFSTSNTLPGGLNAGVTYYVLTILPANTMTVSPTPGGPVLDITTTGTGTQTWHFGTPWTVPADAPAAATRLFFPEDMDLDDIASATDNGAMTVLLVRNFKGRAGDDLDEGTQANLNLADDHILNTPLPWEFLADSAAMKGFLATTTGGATTYTLEGFIFPGTADLTVPIPAIQANGYTPDTIARFAGNAAANNSAAWYGANLFGTAGTSTVYDPAQFFPSTLNGGKVTPGQPNIFALTDDSDTDGDGVLYLMEVALGMNPFLSDTAKLPQPSRITANSVLQPSFIVVRPTGGVAGITYTVQASFDLQSWTLPTVTHTTSNNVPAAGMETQTFLVDSNFLPLLDIRKRAYFRLRVQRQP